MAVRPEENHVSRQRRAQLVSVTIASGLTLGATYAMVAMSLVMGALPTGVFNFAAGAIAVAGSYLAYLGMHSLGLGLLPTIVLTTMGGFVLGALCETCCLRPLRRQQRRGAAAGEVHTELITTVGATFMIVGLAGVIWGFQPLAVPFKGPHGAVTLLGARLAPVQIILIVGAVVLAAALSTWAQRTTTGQAVRAASENREAAALRGINVSYLSVGSWAAGGAIAALGGLLSGPTTFVFPTLATLLVLPAFVALGIGGFNSFIGAAIGGIAVGLVAAFAARYIGSLYQDISVLAALLVVFAVRPQGLGGAARARRV
jgi:branched-chain amino acid transport system permease protein